MFFKKYHLFHSCLFQPSAQLFYLSFSVFHLNKNHRFYRSKARHHLYPPFFSLLFHATNINPNFSSHLPKK
eukprot:UN16535